MDRMLDDAADGPPCALIPDVVADRAVVGAEDGTTLAGVAAGFTAAALLGVGAVLVLGTEALVTAGPLLLVAAVAFAAGRAGLSADGVEVPEEGVEAAEAACAA